MFLLMFYTPKGTEGGLIVFTYVLSPRRDSAKQIPKEVQFFLLMSYFVLGNVYWTFNLLLKKRHFGTFKMFYCDGTDGIDGTGRSKKCPSIFFILYGHLEKV